jgi:hypothetical protein
MKNLYIRTLLSKDKYVPHSPFIITLDKSIFSDIEQVYLDASARLECPVIGENFVYETKRAKDYSK